MKRYTLLLLFFASSVCSYAYDRPQKDGKAVNFDSLQHHIDSLICTKEYKHYLDKAADDPSIDSWLIVDKNIATYTVGKPTSETLHKKKKKYTILFTVRYDLKQDKIISVR